MGGQKENTCFRSKVKLQLEKNKPGEKKNSEKHLKGPGGGGFERKKLNPRGEKGGGVYLKITPRGEG